MPNGRLSRCVISARTPAEVYHNSSGEAASVTLYANTISTSVNTEMSVVVGIASTTLSATTTMVTASAGTFCSMTNVLYAYDYNHENGYNNNNIGVAKTFIGMNKLPRCNICGGTGDSVDYLDANVANTYTDPLGCTITRVQCAGANTSNGQCTFVYNCIGNSQCVYQQWGGNEQQNPSIWMRQLPASCNCCGYFWGGKIVGYFYNCCCSCCWAPQTRCYGTSGTWHPIKAVNVGMGVSTNAAIVANQVWTTWCCCCGKIGDNKMPIVSFNGCSSCIANDAACFGNVCHYQFCKMCACCCNCGAGHKMWNWYALDREFQCCCEDFNDSNNQCFKCKTPATEATSSQCLPSAAEGSLLSPLWGTFYWCQGQGQGCINYGQIKTCWYAAQPACGENCWAYFGNQEMNSPETHAYYWYYNTCKYCHPCVTANFMVNSWDSTESCKISPFGFVYGMTNCSLAFWSCASDVGGDFTHKYSFTYPDACYGKKCAGHSNCFFQQWQKLWISPTDSTGTSSVSNEMPIKYWAWNCMGVTNKHGTCGCTYIMIRSADPNHCGIFTMDAHDSRVYQGPFCGCNGAAWKCCNMIEVSEHGKTWYPCDTERFTKVGDFPAALSCSKYVNGFGTMCMSCLYRTDLCNWIIMAYNPTCISPRTYGSWDAFESSDLIAWTKITSPYSKKVSDVLTTSVTSDYACIVDDCNCFFSGIDCSGIIDWKLSVGQYERTGIVLSDGDRIMVNNDGDIKTSFQVWGYEG